MRNFVFYSITVLLYLALLVLTTLLDFGLLHILFTICLGTLTFAIFIWAIFIKAKLVNATALETLEKKTYILSSVVESSDDAIVSKDVDGIIRTWNKAAEILYGYTEEEVVGKHINIIVPKDRLLEEKNLLNTIKQGKKVLHYETRRLKKDGSLVDVSLTLSSIVNSKGENIGTSKIARDITERKIQEQELIKSSERYKNFIENNDDAIWRVEFKTPIDINLDFKTQIEMFFNEGVVEEANKGTYQILHLPTETSLVKKRMKDVGTRTDNDAKFLTHFIKSGYTVTDYESIETMPDKLKYHKTSMLGVIENGFLVRTWVIRKDVTQQKEALIERERLLLESQKSKEELEIALKEKDRFFANLSHELRTPLVSILGYSSMLKDSKNINELSEGIHVINKNAVLQLSLIEDLIDISKVVSGKIKLHKEKLHLNDVIIETIKRFKPDATKKSLSINFNCEPLPIYADKKRISQILNNLLSNAIKFTSVGHIDINGGKATNGFWVSVSDTGIGIKKEDLHTLFKPFSQINTGFTKIKPGLGLGLSIVKFLTDLHHGTIETNSTFGKGTTFTITIPNEIEHSFEGVSLLLVEDDVDAGNLLKTYLQKRGADVTLEISAEAALNTLKSKKFDLYVFDLSMPEQDGLSLMSTLRKSGDVTPSVALTAFVDHKELALKNGFNLFMSKPVDFSEFGEIRKLVK